MTTCVAFVDLDGVLVDDRERRQRARIAASVRYNREKAPELWRETFEQLHYNPTYVGLDKLLYEDAPQDVRRLGDQGYLVVYTTARIESMREATAKWLKEHQLMLAKRTVLANRLVMRPKFAVGMDMHIWKAITIMVLATAVGATDVVFIDDDQDTRVAASDAATGYPFNIRCFDSLPGALKYTYY